MENKKDSFIMQSNLHITVCIELNEIISGIIWYHIRDIIWNFSTDIQSNIDSHLKHQLNCISDE